MNLDDWIGLGYVLLTQGPQQRLRFGPRVPEYEVERSLHSIRERFIARFILAGDLFRGSRN